MVTQTVGLSLFPGYNLLSGLAFCFRCTLRSYKHLFYERFALGAWYQQSI